MAFVTVGNASGFWLTVTLVDNGGDKSTLQYELTSADQATAVTDTATILAAIGNMSLSTVQSYNISLRMEENAFAYPASGVENQDKARIVYQLAGSTKKGALDIPAPDPLIFNGTSGKQANVVNLSDTPVLVYLALFQAAGEALISDGEILDFAVEGRRVSSRKGFRG